MNYLPDTVNINRGAVSRTGQVPDLSGPPIITRDTFEKILTDVVSGHSTKVDLICQHG